MIFHFDYSHLLFPKVLMIVLFFSYKDRGIIEVK